MKGKQMQSKKKKKVIKLLIVLIVVIGLFFLPKRCDASFVIEGLEIKKYPDKLIYIIGSDTNLDLSGGEICLRLKFDLPVYISMDSRYFKIFHNIDFETPDVYAVEISGLFNEKCKQQFAIQVISLSELEEMINCYEE